MIALMVTVLPQPDSPTSPTVSPRSISKLASSTTTVRPVRVGKVTVSPRIDRSDGAAGASPTEERAVAADLRAGGAVQLSVTESRTASPQSDNARIVRAMVIPGGQI